jgi:hypothetical protein
MTPCVLMPLVEPGVIALRSTGGKSNIADFGWESSVSPL